MNLKRFSAIIGGLFIATSFTLDAATIVRSCNGKFEIRNPNTGGKVTLEVFVAKGNCGAAVPNRCRIRAKTAAHKCMQIHWDTRWERKKPEHCQPGAKVYEYSITDLKRRIEEKACAVWGPGTTVELWRITSGDTKCGSAKRITRTYKILPEMCK